MRFTMLLVSALSVAMLAGCGPITQDPPGNGQDASNGGTDGSGQCEATELTEMTCADGVDNDCDGWFDCSDTDCTALCNPDPPSADAMECEDPIFPGDTLAIPDILGVDFESSITTDGFDPGQTLTDANDFLRICVTMEHSWLRDLQIELDCPSGTTLALQQFRGQTGFEIFMGEPNHGDGTDPTPGVGYEYCWTPTATRGPSMTEWSDTNLTFGDTLPDGDWQSSDPFTNFEGCELNGTWTLRVVDDWGSDNGFIFGWFLEFSENILPECLIVIIE